MTLKENDTFYFIKNNEIYIRLWTFQPLEILDVLEENGTFICDENKSTYLQENSFKHAYNWLAKQMTLFIGKKPKNVKYPIWAWYLVDSANTQPKACHFSLYDPEEDLSKVCLELEVPLNQVMLTDYDAWHNVLNSDYYSTLTGDDWEKEMDWIDMQDLKLRNYLIKKSWEKIILILIKTIYMNTHISKQHFGS